MTVEIAEQRLNKYFFKLYSLHFFQIILPHTQTFPNVYWFVFAREKLNLPIKPGKR